MKQLRDDANQHRNHGCNYKVTSRASSRLQKLLSLDSRLPRFAAALKICKPQCQSALVAHGEAPASNMRAAPVQHSNHAHKRCASPMR
jgi:hypothetical protein